VRVVKATRATLTPAFLREVLARAAEEPALGRRLGEGERELTVRLTGDRELRRLNKAFLGLDEPTDVLSFPSGDSDGYLGDLALSWPAVVRQAAMFGHPVAVEAALLTVHGLLHLLGWDHARPSEAREMDRLTQACLVRAGLPPVAERLDAVAAEIPERVDRVPETDLRGRLSPS
jgi:probable rRNA maturation factor